MSYFANNVRYALYMVTLACLFQLCGTQCDWIQRSERALVWKYPISCSARTRSCQTSSLVQHPKLNTLKYLGPKLERRNFHRQLCLCKGRRRSSLIQTLHYRDKGKRINSIRELEWFSFYLYFIQSNLFSLSLSLSTYAYFLVHFFLCCLSAMKFNLFELNFLNSQLLSLFPPIHQPSPLDHCKFHLFTSGRQYYLLSQNIVSKYWIGWQARRANTYGRLAKTRLHESWPQRESVLVRVA